MEERGNSLPHHMSILRRTGSSSSSGNFSPGRSPEGGSGETTSESLTTWTTGSSSTFQGRRLSVSPETDHGGPYSTALPEQLHLVGSLSQDDTEEETAAQGPNTPPSTSGRKSQRIDHSKPDGARKASARKSKQHRCRALCYPLHLCWLVHPYRFSEAGLEEIYHQYYTPLRLINIAVCSILLLSCHTGMQLVLLASRLNNSPFLKTDLQRKSLVSDVLMCVLYFAMAVVTASLFKKSLKTSPLPGNNTPVRLASVLLMVLMVIDCFLVTDHAYSQPRTPTTALWYVTIVVMLINTKLTINPGINLLTSVALAIVWSMYSVAKSDVCEQLRRQMIAVAFLLSMSIGLGVSYRLLGERILRRSIMDMIRHIEQGARLKQETGQQKSLLLSIFPDSVAQQMTEEVVHDLEEHFSKFGENNDGEELPFLLAVKQGDQFYRSFMDRCENVSILCADIVSFTETSSMMSPQELVAMLNDVFARFDDMAQEVGCDRIKILGDGYVCVAGVPQYCTNHADKCVRTGLRFAKEIGGISARHGKSLQLRVGIHSGAVLCGVLGLKKWSFDVWGNDVSIASRLESTGKPGYIHISSVTLGLLDDVTDCIIEDADPVTHNKSVIETAFITNNDSLKFDPTMQGAARITIRRRSSGVRPFSDFYPETVSPVNTEPDIVGQAAIMPEDLGVMCANIQNVQTRNEQASVDVDQRSLETGLDVAKSVKAAAKSTSTEPKRKRKAEKQPATKSEQEAYDILATEIRCRGDQVTFLEKLHGGTLTFKDRCVAETYFNMPDSTFEINLLVYAVAIIFSMHVMRIAVATSLLVRLIGYIGLLPSFFVIILLLLKLASKRFRKTINPFIRKIRCSPSLRMVISLSTFAFLHTMLDIGMITCRQRSLAPRLVPLDNCTVLHPSETVQCRLLNDRLLAVDASNCEPYGASQDDVCSQVACNVTSNAGMHIPTPLASSSSGCHFPHLVRYAEMFALIGMMMIMRLRYIHLVPYVIFLGTVSVTLALTLFQSSYADAYFYWISISSNPHYPPNFTHSSVFLVVIATLMVLVHAIPTEVFMKLSHLSYEKYSKITNKKKQLRQANLYLLHNILPRHVAKHFLSAKTMSKHLYSCYHNNVAVMFCSIPNFADTFYQESSSNRHGMECLRLLNEIFADWDKLLSKPEYSGVEKIKTIGPTYMLAAGLDQPLTQHCPADMLADFAKSMFEVITEINAHAFQNFKLRIGLHTGPVVSGVIGAKKPLFDIWGDTVNVASRMDSTGVNGKVQVTKETAYVLMRHGYTVKKRGNVVVKGKGDVTTYLVLDWPDKKSRAMRAKFMFSNV